MNTHEPFNETGNGPSPAEEAQHILRTSPYGAFRKLECRFHDGELMLSGQLPTFHLKQLAQNAVKNLKGVRQIKNDIEVAD